MRILCVTAYYKPAYVYGGPTRSVPSLCEGLVKAGAQVSVYTTNANGPRKILDVQTDQPVNIDGVEVYYHSLSKTVAYMAPYYFYSPFLGKACVSNIAQFDIVYIPGDWTYTVLAGARAAFRANVPYVISPRGSFMDWSMSQGTIKKRLYLALIGRALINRAAAIHVTCSLEQLQQKKWGFTPPTFVSPNGIDVTSFDTLPQRGKLRQTLEIPENAILSLFVGRLHKMKRLELTIDAFATLANQLTEAHLLIVGSDQDGSGKAAMEQAHLLGLSDRVHFVGLLTGVDLLQAYADSDLLVLLSHRENFGMVAVEAMAAGLPVLLSKQVGLAEEVEQAKAGFAVEANLKEIGAVWYRLLCQPDLRRAMGERGRKLVREHFASNVMAGQMLERFASILNKA
jgi:glycosyltransferase involved in cell wall biosynthesis